MDGVIEAIHIYDDHLTPILSHTYTGRPISAVELLPLYLERWRQQQQSSHSVLLANNKDTASLGAPPSLLYVPDSHPPTLVFGMVHAGLLFLAAAAAELEPLLALEFLHRVADTLEVFLGSPLLPAKIEGSYDVVAQLLTEMCDAGTVNTTEPNALRDLVEVEGLVGKLLGSITMPAGITLPGTTPGAGGGGGGGGGSGLGGGGGIGGGRHGSSSPSFYSSSSATAAASLSSHASPSPSALPWRRANVRHTSNEMYADIIESLCVTLAPSGRPLAAFAHGSIVFHSKISGVPDILLTLAGPAGSGATNKAHLGRLLQLPVFHPCVRLARWKEQPGLLSFVPPDGRFLLAAYEVDLMPGIAYSASPSAASAASFSSSSHNTLRLPVSVEVRTSLGPVGADFEVRVHVNRSFAAGSHGSSSGGPAAAGTPSSPLLERLRITVPLPAEVRNLPEMRPTRGDVVYSPGGRSLEWNISAKDLSSSSAGTAYFGLRCTAVGQSRGVGGFDDDDDDDDDDGEAGNGVVAGQDDYGFGRGVQEYTVHDTTPLQKQKTQKARQPAGFHTTANKENESATGFHTTANNEDEAATAAARKTAARIRLNKALMPGSAAVSFSVKGWLASGLRVDSMLLDSKRSRGLGESVKPFKGVKYLTVSKGGVELRC